MKTTTWLKTTMSFNLTLLECKYETLILVSSLKKVLILPYWNVNFCFAWPYSSRCVVLILPYWNVNKELESQCILFDNGFNLTLLECKYSEINAGNSAKSVLILPYWNVNILKPRVNGISNIVLILPYWNVNVAV